jgi:hypothetical protein
LSEEKIRAPCDLVLVVASRLCVCDGNCNRVDIKSHRNAPQGCCLYERGAAAAEGIEHNISFLGKGIQKCANNWRMKLGREPKQVMGKAMSRTATPLYRKPAAVFTGTADRDRGAIIAPRSAAHVVNP